MPMRRYNFARLDAPQNAFFSMALSYVESKLFEDEQRELLTRTLVPKIDGIPPAAASYVWHTWGRVGLAKIIASYADDLPRADVAGDEQVAIIKSVGASFGYNIMEIRQAQMAQTPLPQAKANAAARAVDERFDAILSKGDTTHNLQGMLNLPNATLYTLPVGTSGFADWPRKVGAEIIADMVGIANHQVKITKNAEKPDTMLLDLDSYSYVAQTPFNNFTNATILETFQKVSPYVKTVIPWLELAGAGVGGTNRMMVYRRSNDVLGAIIPQEMETLPAQEHNLEFITPVHARIGGVAVFRPLGVSYADGL